MPGTERIWARAYKKAAKRAGAAATEQERMGLPSAAARTAEANYASDATESKRKVKISRQDQEDIGRGYRKVK